jgi:hypothetical protein
MSHSWNATILDSEAKVLHVLTELRGKRWLCRGQSKRYGGLVPSIDREPRQNLSRLEKLALERRSIDLFRSTARFFAHPGEHIALTNDIIALMVLRHYEVPTRLLDWSKSPWVAAYFAAQHYDKQDGEIWTFDEPLYEQEGKKQWARWPETTTDRSGDPSKFDANLTAFDLQEPPDWFICCFYSSAFPRQAAQDSAYTMTARFGRDHAAAIASLLANRTAYHLYLVPASIKPTLRRLIHERHGIWRGSLFPDSAGAAETARIVFSGDEI